MGNWSNYTQTGGTSGINQDRQTNSLNEITGYNNSAWAVPGYDNAGNMTTMPQPGNETVGLTCTYDAWNRLVEVESGSTVLATVFLRRARSSHYGNGWRADYGLLLRFP